MRHRLGSLRRLPILATASLTAVSLTLAACGDSEGPQARDSAPVATDGPSATSPGGMRAPTPIEYTAGALGAPGTRSAVPASAESDTSLVAPTFVAEFLVGDDLPELPSNDTGYVYDADTPATAEQAAEVAAVFGVTDEPVEVDQWEPGGWQVGPTDGSGPSVYLGDDAQHNWSFSPAWSDRAVSSSSPGCADPAPAGTVGDDLSYPCPTPTTEVTPPAGVPTADEARAEADALLGELGVDASDLTVDTYADEWSASVDYSDTATGRYWNFGFGAEGALQWANGTLGVPEPVGPYPLVDLDTALERLREYQFGGGIPIPVDPAVADVAIASPGVPEPAVDMVPAVAPSTAPADPRIMPAPDGTVPPPQPVTVTLVDVESDSWWAWDAEGNVWIVPAYRFIGDDGGWYVVPAVTDKYLIEIPAPEPVPGTGPVASPAPGDAPTTVPGVDIPTGPSDTAALDALVGSSLEEFSGAAEALGFTVRVSEIDGEPQAVTMDYNPSRVNVAVETTPDGGQTVTAVLNLG